MKNGHYNQLIRLALSEDIGSGDITTKAIGLKRKKGRARVIAKADGVVSGLDIFKQVFKQLSPSFSYRAYKKDGSNIARGEKIIEISGPLELLLVGERTSMNFLCHLSGIATTTRKYVNEINGYRAEILDTRKTTPGMRLLEKKAVKDGGGLNHRIGLFDMYLIKENHIAAAGSLEKALELTIQHRRRTKAKIEIEVRNLVELKKAIKLNPDYILLDNFSIGQLKKGVSIAKRLNPAIILESSGNVSIENVREIASTGVDRISIGKLTHSAAVLDLSFQVLNWKK
jgi:nicotinate-nucleotide pyrophosphorylase (carboxylating)